ncbi:TIGR01777 family oxidoreductase [Alkalihalobacillus oceani]|uniref:TIGR01777 family oxidoreductase n=1 Tax=Halalkalibacter oceani TaxID=1653776 RepID=UPI00203F7D01|nr:TIGR01777 family oxidoreductase [Halalkalibacter oceani]MCM3762228.1 TIGR01777 family oxidoreductase [Halalkalibacter oceani]
MQIAIAGGSGFIGTKLSEYFVKQGHTVYILTRNAGNKPSKNGITYVEWLNGQAKPEQVLEGIDAFVNLAGESIGSGRWTAKRKQRIVQSRIETTRAVIALFNALDKKPEVLINASAVGYYGNSERAVFTEESSPIESDFLSDVVQRWEHEAARARDFGIRVVYCRLGIVLDKDEGALQRMLLPYQLFAGGTLGSGKQWVSWIHIRDVIGMIDFALTNPEIDGPFNLTTPTPLQMKEFGKTIAAVLHRPHWIPAPSFALKALLGEMSTLVLDGQQVLPEKAEKHGYAYHFPNAKQALEDLLKSH